MKKMKKKNKPKTKPKPKVRHKVERMKAELRIPTTQYGYVSVEYYGTTQEIIAKHNEFVEKYDATVPKEVLEDKEIW